MKLESVWQCGECGETHDDEYDARDCCRPSITEGYLCPECKDFHASEREALACCADDDAPLLAQSAAELEAAGQLRLIQ